VIKVAISYVQYLYGIWMERAWHGTSQSEEASTDENTRLAELDTCRGDCRFGRVEPDHVFQPLLKGDDNQRGKQVTSPLHGTNLGRPSLGALLFKRPWTQCKPRRPHLASPIRTCNRKNVASPRINQHS
jgi:hypothetical protein